MMMMMMMNDDWLQRSCCAVTVTQKVITKCVVYMTVKHVMM